MKPIIEFDINDSKQAHLYDELPLWSAPFGLKLLDRIPVRKNMTILDVGCGTGFLSIELAQRCGNSSTVYAVDPWQAAMDRLQTKIDFLSLDNVHLIRKDAGLIDPGEITDDSVNLIVSNLGINNFDNAESVYANLYRMAKPQAEFFLTTNLTGHMHEFYELFDETLTELGQQDCLAELNQHIQHRGTAESVSDDLTKAGFSVETVEADTFTMRFADGKSLFDHYLIRIGFLSAWKSIVNPDPIDDPNHLVDSERIDEIFSHLENKLNDYAAQHNEIALTIPMALFQAKKR